VYGFEDRLLNLPQTMLHTQHVFHAGMYARTIDLVPDQIITGALIKRATLVIVGGTVDVFVGSQVLHLVGYNLLPASAGRKQVFRAHTAATITMVFPSQALSVEEAEQEFTDEYERLASHAGTNEVVRTGE
jgi:predicted SpoU family rRNA methylase